VTVIIETPQDTAQLNAAVAAFRQVSPAAALTGAGISVESGIPDFRSEGGLWTIFEPGEYATIDVFLSDPAKAWRLYRALGQALLGKEPNPAHTALARLESGGHLEAVVTQNVDGLHQAAGSQRVVEVHGDHQHLHCLQCGWLEPALPDHVQEDAELPRCPKCRFALKPNVVLFGEEVRSMDKAAEVMSCCGAVLVVGTSVQVYPAAGLPAIVKRRGGLIFEFNIERTELSGDMTDSFRLGQPWGMGSMISDYLFVGPAGKLLPVFVDAVLES
jgi:NAD-dependent deacetylase